SPRGDGNTKSAVLRWSSTAQSEPMIMYSHKDRIIIGLKRGAPHVGAPCAHRVRETCGQARGMVGRPFHNGGPHVRAWSPDHAPVASPAPRSGSHSQGAAGGVQRSLARAGAWGGILTTILVRGTLPSCWCSFPRPSVSPSRSIDRGRTLAGLSPELPSGLLDHPARAGKLRRTRGRLGPGRTGGALLVAPGSGGALAPVAALEAPFPAR